MKALKNESASYTSKITAAITECYQAGAEPCDAELMALYSLIGLCICEQGEKAYVVHLAQALAEQLPQVKGFSPRNLRRMRDFYRAYENSPFLMERAQALNWTQNTVILECCETNEQRTFYIHLAAERKLSKLALMDAIEQDAFSASVSETANQNVRTAAAPVCGDMDTEAVDTAPAEQTRCGAFVTMCEPLRQGDGAPIRTVSAFRADNLFCVAGWMEQQKLPKIIPQLPPHGKKKNAPPLGRTIYRPPARLPCPLLASA